MVVSAVDKKRVAACTVAVVASDRVAVHMVGLVEADSQGWGNSEAEGNIAMAWFDIPAHRWTQVVARPLVMMLAIVRCLVVDMTKDISP